MRVARLTVLVSGLLLAYGAVAPPAVFALPGEIAPVASSVPDAYAAVDLVRSGDLRRAIELTAPGRAAIAGDVRSPDDRLRRLGLVHVVARAVRFLIERDGEHGLETLLAQAAARARPEDLPLLRLLERSSPRAAPYARALARTAIDKITAACDPRVLVEFVHGDDPSARRRALSALGERFARTHEKVDAGGTLDLAEQSEVSDPAVVAALVEALDERRVELDVLPHDLAATASPSALHDLALVDTPAIQSLQEAKRNGVPGASVALDSVLEAALVRLRRHPRSSWSSAAGALPAIVPGAPVCSSCTRPLPAGSHFCPACGTTAPLTACSRCGGIVLSGVCPRCGGSGQGEARKCTNCLEPIGAFDKFCHRCGAPRAP